MGKRALAGLIALLLSSCSTHRWEGGQPRLRLTAESRVAEIPATIRFQAFIEGARDDEPRLYCPDVIWNFQDVAFRDERDCDPYEPGLRIQRAYTAEHTFDREGAYDVNVTLLQRGRRVLSATVTLQVARTGARIRHPL